MAKRILVIDDDPMSRLLSRRILEQESYEVRELESATNLQSALQDFAPDLVLCDLIMPGQDGLSVCRTLRADPQTWDIQVVVMSAKNFEADRRMALAAGATRYLVKPLSKADLLKAVEEALPSGVTLKIWGARGSTPAPERALGHYGGNTSCVALGLPDGRQIIFDGGTGIRGLGNSLLEPAPMQFHICITHCHWDHIQGLPFFKPLYAPGNEINLYAPADSDAALAEIMEGQMGRDYFPVSMSSLASSVKYTALNEMDFEILEMPISTFHVFHPGRTLAYRVHLEGCSVVYVPDNELVPEFAKPEVSGEPLRFARFAFGASLLIHDCAYSRAVYEKRRGWGHSCGEILATVAAHANVKRVLLFHHDPDNSDEDVAAIHQEFRNAVESLDAEIESELATEGATLTL